ncbi:unnamed protein product [Caenorhabditis nigoni]|uniref:F-box domain-containing protein n=1 Tax=Caenorhabditis nigoni TaxID=1611254 RepID=A0A2G5SIG4_9PELO|nr:hypothetical protein B9Z55_027028 [Caenorhabditis nigoni]
MELSSDFIEKNQHFLKSCILYEVLRKKPIMDSYRTFCDTVGKDAMEYPDFEFWYYQFYHGNRDLDYDRSADPEPKTFVDMPVVLMTKIVEYLNPVERARLRYVNHAIKAVADSFPLVMEKIEIVVNQFSMYGTLNKKRFEFFKKGSGSTLYEPMSSEAEESDKCFMEKGIEHLALMLKTPKFQANHLSLNILDETLNLNDFLPIPFNAKSVFINGRTTNQVVQFLSAMNPGHLESINLFDGVSRETLNYKRVFKTDQIKQAKSVELPFMGMKADDLLIFSHYKNFKCHLKSENTLEDVPRIRDIIATFEKLQSCELDYHCVSDCVPIRVFAMALGEEIPIESLIKDRHMVIIHRYQIPESNECLEFKMREDNRYHCLVNIVKIR